LRAQDTRRGGSAPRDRSGARRRALRQSRSVAGGGGGLARGERGAADSARAAGGAARGGGEVEQGDRRGPAHQRQDRGVPPRASDAKTAVTRRRGYRSIRHPTGNDRSVGTGVFPSRA